MRVFTSCRSHDLQSIVSASGFGLGVISFSVFLLGSFNILFVKVFLLLCVVIALVNYKDLRSGLSGVKSLCNNLTGMSPVSLTLLFIFLFLALLNLLSTLAPLTSIDALDVHFALPFLLFEGF